MAGRGLVWALSLPLAAAGWLGAHSVAYVLVVPDHDDRAGAATCASDVLAPTGPDARPAPAGQVPAAPRAALPGPGSTWTTRHLAWLRSLRFDDVCSQATFADYLASVELLVARRQSLLCTLEQQVPDCSHAPTIAALRCFRGIDTLSAAGLCAEVGDWVRFPKPNHVSGFVGIVPSEHTTDSKPFGSTTRVSAHVTSSTTPARRDALPTAGERTMDGTHPRRRPRLSKQRRRAMCGP